MAQASLSRAYALGLSYGNFWLVAAGLGFAILDAFNINTTFQGTLLSVIGILLLGGCLLFFWIRCLRLSYSIPRSSTGSGRISATRRGIFMGLIALEFIGWGAVNAVIGSHALFDWIVPIDLLVIGAHFIPLAIVFNVPAYLVMGILWIVAVVSVMLLFPSTTILGHVSVWTTIPSLCCVVITWLTSLYLLNTLMKSLRGFSQDVAL